MICGSTPCNQCNNMFAFVVKPGDRIPNSCNQCKEQNEQDMKKVEQTIKFEQQKEALLSHIRISRTASHLE
jgi:hypothetical protein